MADLTEAALNALRSYGPAGLALVLFIAAIGVPLPATMLLLAAGALIRAGEFDWQLAGLFALAGAVLGDSSSYAVGRFASHLVPPFLTRNHAWQQAEATFERWGAMAILLTRFLFTPLALPANLIAGDSYSFRRFLAFDVAGEIIWVVLFGGLGFLVAESWAQLGATIGNLTGALIGLLGAALAIYEVYVHCRGHLLPARIHS